MVYLWRFSVIANEVSKLLFVWAYFVLTFCLFDYCKYLIFKIIY